MWRINEDITADISMANTFTVYANGSVVAKTYRPPQSSSNAETATADSRSQLRRRLQKRERIPGLEYCTNASKWLFMA
jgi:hypothetical protein